VTASQLGRRSLVHGIVIDADVDVGARRSPPHTEPVDLVVRRRTTRVIGSDRPGGVVVAELANRLHDVPFQSITRADDGGYRLRVHGCCEIDLAADGRSIAIDVDPRSDPALAEIVTAGSGLALSIVQRGALALHASAVERAGTAYAFLAGSGTGKSTLATLCCAVGATLVADDLLRVDVVADTAVAHGGATSVRLRRSATALAARVDSGTRVSADDRLLAELPISPRTPVPLGAVLALARTDTDRVRVHWQQGRRALLLLDSSPRLAGWVGLDEAARHFVLCSAVAARIPVGIVELPQWEGAADPHGCVDAAVAEELLDVVGRHTRSTKPAAWSMNSSE